MALILLAATLRKYVSGYDGATGITMNVPPGSSVSDVAERVGIPREEVKLIMVNGVGSTWDTVLKGDERIAFFPPVGGG